MLNGELDQVCATRDPQVSDGMQGAHFGKFLTRATAVAVLEQPWTTRSTRSSSRHDAKAKAPAPPSAAALESSSARRAAAQYRWAELARRHDLHLRRRRMGDDDDKLSPTSRPTASASSGSAPAVFEPEDAAAGGRSAEVAVTLKARICRCSSGLFLRREVTPFVLDTWPEPPGGMWPADAIGPGETTSFEISPMDWIFRAKEPRAAWQTRCARCTYPTFCLAGQRRGADTACDEIAAVEVVRLPSSHHFNAR